MLRKIHVALAAALSAPATRSERSQAVIRTPRRSCTEANALPYRLRTIPAVTLLALAAACAAGSASAATEYGLIAALIGA